MFESVSLQRRVIYEPVLVPGSRYDATILSKSRCMGMRAHLRERLDHAGGVECQAPVPAS